MRNSSTTLRGFTLIELIVSVAIFSVVMVVALGALLSVAAGERRAESIKSVMNNLNFALDSMSRTIRTGYNYKCGSGGGDCTGGNLYMSLTSAAGANVAYCLDAGAIKRHQTSGTPDTSCASANFVPLTAPEVVVTNLTFYVVGTVQNDRTQPKVTISISGYTDVSATQRTTFNLQTTVTQRFIDVL